MPKDCLRPLKARAAPLGRHRRSRFRTLFVEALESRALLAALPSEFAETSGVTDPWSGYAHDAQHTAISAYGSQPLQGIAWQAAVDQSPQFSGEDLLIHYGSPLVSAANTVIVPVKTGASGGF